MGGGEGVVSKVLRRKMDPITNEKQCLVTYVQACIPSAWIPEDQLPLELQTKQNPECALGEIAPPGEGGIEWVWTSQKFTARFQGHTEHFSASNWWGAEKTKRAAVKWLTEKRS